MNWVENVMWVLSLVLVGFLGLCVVGFILLKADILKWGDKWDDPEAIKRGK